MVRASLASQTVGVALSPYRKSTPWTSGTGGEDRNILEEPTNFSPLSRTSAMPPGGSEERAGRMTRTTGSTAVRSMDDTRNSLVFPPPKTTMAVTSLLGLGACLLSIWAVMRSTTFPWLSVTIW